MPVWRIRTEHTDYFGVERDGALVRVDAEGSVLHEFAPRADPSSDVFRSEWSGPGAPPVVAETKLGAGEWHPRIWRKGATPRPEETHRSVWSASVQAAQNLLAHLREIFRFVEPCEGNWSASGHEIRELLMLAAMEVESGWKAILRENNYVSVPADRRWNRNDYAQLVGPMRLNEWVVRIASHPDAGTLKPFAGWGPQQKLPWYDAYNNVKHDRETNMTQASLRHCVDAVAGVFVMVCAQFGYWAEAGGGDLSLATYQSVIPRELVAVQNFRMVHQPEWSLEELYVPPEVARLPTWSAKPLFCE